MDAIWTFVAPMLAIILVSCYFYLENNVWGGKGLEVVINICRHCNPRFLRLKVGRQLTKTAHK